MRLQPPVKLVEPVVARCALLAHAPSVTTVFIKVQFRFVSGCLERVVERRPLWTFVDVGTALYSLDHLQRIKAHSPQVQRIIYAHSAVICLYPPPRPCEDGYPGANSGTSQLCLTIAAGNVHTKIPEFAGAKRNRISRKLLLLFLSRPADTRATASSPAH